MNGDSTPSLRSRRKNVLRRDSRVGSAEREIARVFGLPEGAVRLVNPDGRNARSDKRVAVLLRQWSF